MPRRSSASPPVDSPDSRLLQAMADVASAKGLSAVTVADVVRVAGVSKRTFYEHFGDKEACFLQLYREASASALRTLSEAVQPDLPWQAQVETALGAYFQHLSAGPQLLRTLFVEIHQMGEAGSLARREVLATFADFTRETVNRGRPTAEAMSPAMAMAAVGAMMELVLQAIEQHEEEHLVKLVPVASDIVRRLALA